MSYHVLSWINYHNPLLITSVIYQQVELHLLLLHQFFQPVALEHLGTSWNRQGPDPLGSGKPWKTTGHGDGFSVYLRTLRPGGMGNIWKHG